MNDILHSKKEQLNKWLQIKVKQNQAWGKNIPMPKNNFKEQF